jgi:hypothetical protein
MEKFSLKNLKEFFHTHESLFTSLTLVGGFIFDYLTLQRVDYLFDNVLIIGYLLVSGASILIKNIYETGKFHNKFTNSVYEFLPFTLQFAFGGLFSAFTIFYSKSASFLSTGIFVLILFILMIGNEFFKKRYQKLVFQIGIYFVAIFSFSIYFLPVLIKKMGVIVFLGSGLLSLALIGIFIFLISRFAPTRYIESRKFIYLTVFGLWALLNILYFTNIIPPIPLSLKTGEVYHLIEKQTGGGYLVTGEAKSKWYENLTLPRKIYLTPGKGAYVFSSVFAPTDLNIRIVHDWQYYDEQDKKWISANRIAFPIRGGRNEGYRGFSKKESIFPGKWRVDIETERGQVIGRVRFDIEIGNFTPELQTRKI